MPPNGCMRQTGDSSQQLFKTVKFITIVGTYSYQLNITIVLIQYSRVARAFVPTGYRLHGLPALGRSTKLGYVPYYYPFDKLKADL